MARDAPRDYPRTVTIWHDGRFIEWDTAAQRPWVYNRDPGDFHKTLHVRWGPYSWAKVNAVMRLARDYGTSLGPTVTAAEVVAGNRLGEQGEELGLDEIFARFRMEGLPADLPARFATITGVPSVDEAELAARDAEWRAFAGEMTLRELARHKERMAKRGFPFEAAAAEAGGGSARRRCRRGGGGPGRCPRRGRRRGRVARLRQGERAGPGRPVRSHRRSSRARRASIPPPRTVSTILAPFAQPSRRLSAAGRPIWPLLLTVRMTGWMR